MPTPVLLCLCQHLWWRTKQRRVECQLVRNFESSGTYRSTVRVWAGVKARVRLRMRHLKNNLLAILCPPPPLAQS